MMNATKQKRHADAVLAYQHARELYRSYSSKNRPEHVLMLYRAAQETLENIRIEETL